MSVIRAKIFYFLHSVNQGLWVCKTLKGKSVNIHSVWFFFSVNSKTDQLGFNSRPRLPSSLFILHTIFNDLLGSGQSRTDSCPLIFANFMKTDYHIKGFPSLRFSWVSFAKEFHVENRLIKSDEIKGFVTLRLITANINSLKEPQGEVFAATNWTLLNEFERR